MSKGKKRFIRFYLSVLPFAFVIALFEIAIEGKEGWAKGLYNFGIYADGKWGMLIGGGKPWTPYHGLLNLIYLMSLHFYFWKGKRWTTIGKAARITSKCFAWMIACWCVEDFLWFTFNPYYGISNLTSQHVWWHNWIGPIPDMYILLPPVSLLFYWLAYRERK